MTDAQIKKREIQSALAKIPTSALLEIARRLLEVLGYRSQRTLNLLGSVDDFIEQLPALNKNTATEQEFCDEAESVELVFQVTSDEITTNNQSKPFESNTLDEEEIKSFLFFAVELMGKDYPRGKYAQFTREINKRFMMPVVVFFASGTV